MLITFLALISYKDSVLQIYAVLYRSHWPHVASEPLRCRGPEPRCAVSAKDTLDSKDLILKNMNINISFVSFILRTWK